MLRSPGRGRTMIAGQVTECGIACDAIQDPRWERPWLVAIVRPALFIHALTLTAAGCIHELPTVATPGLATPPLSAAPVPPGCGRLYLDVVDGPTEVQVVKPITGQEELNGETFETQTLEVQTACITPCVLDLPLGRHLLDFPMRGSGGEDVVGVIASPSPTIYRRALGWRQSGDAGFVLGVLGASLGGTSFVTGAALLPVGLARDSHGVTLAGAITLGVGALLTAAGIWAIIDHPLMQQAGAGAQYELPGSDGAH
jgi:hypothetical protein